MKKILMLTLMILTLVGSSESRVTHKHHKNKITAILPVKSSPRMMATQTLINPNTQIGGPLVSTNNMLPGVASDSADGITVSGKVTTPNLSVSNLTGYVYANGSSASTASTTIPNTGLANSATTVNGQTCTLGSTCTVTSTASNNLTLTDGAASTKTYDGSSAQTINYISSSETSAQTMDGNLSLAGTLSTTTPTFTALTGYLYGNGSSAVTASTKIPNSGLTNSSITVNGTTCTLGSSCSPSSSASSIAVGTTTISSGTSGYIEYNNSGVLGELATTGSGSVVLATALNSYLPLSGGTLTGSLYGTSSVFSGTVEGSYVQSDNLVVDQCVQAASSGKLVSSGYACGVGTTLSGGVLGSIPYQSASAVTSYVSPNTSTTPMSLTMTGTGSAGTTPVWSDLSNTYVSKTQTTVQTLAGPLAWVGGDTGTPAETTLANLGGISSVLATTQTMAGGLNSSGINGTYNAAACGYSIAPTWCSGSDIGAWINAAFTACSTCTVHVPQGTYTQTTTILVPLGSAGTSGTLEGDGAGSVLSYTGSGYAISLAGTGQSKAAVKLRNFAIALTSSATAGIYTTSFNLGTIEDVTIRGTGSGTADCVKNAGTNALTIINPDFSGCYNGVHDIGITGYAANAIAIIGGQITGNKNWGRYEDGTTQPAGCPEGNSDFATVYEENGSSGSGGNLFLQCVDGYTSTASYFEYASGVTNTAQVQLGDSAYNAQGPTFINDRFYSAGIDTDTFYDFNSSRTSLLGENREYGAVTNFYYHGTLSSGTYIAQASGGSAVTNFFAGYDTEADTVANCTFCVNGQSPSAYGYKFLELSGLASDLVIRERASSSGNVVIFDSYDGSEVAYISNTGVVGGSGLAASSLGSSTTSLCTTTGGVLTNTGCDNGVFVGGQATIGGSALTAGSCSSLTSTVTGATTAMTVVMSPAGTSPGGGYVWRGYVSAANTITLQVCALIAGTPSSLTYNFGVIR